jgi:hypothetical protein
MNPWVVRNAYYANGKTIFGWIDGSNGDCQVASWDHASETMDTTFTLRAALEADHHTSPALLRRVSDGRILAFYGRHNYVVLYRRLSSFGDDVSAWGSELDVDSQLGGTNYTDWQTHQLDGEANDPIFLFYRDEPSPGTDSRWCYSWSTDGNGAVWAGQTILFHQAGLRSYWVTYSDGATRIHVAGNNTGGGGASKLGHFYYEGGAFYKSDGTAMGSPPFDIDDVTVIKSASTTFYAWHITLDANGYPIITAQEVAANGHWLNWYFRWDGAAWNETYVADGGTGYTYSSPISNSGYGCTVDDQDPNVMYYITPVSGTPEVLKVVSTDDGATWGPPLAITVGSGVLQNQITPVRNRDPSLKVLWAFGGYFTDYTHFQMGTRGTST